MTIRGYDGSEAIIQAIIYAITVLIVSCPCTIVLAVPMVIVIASGVVAERGIIFKSAYAIEVAHKTSQVVFDKTGTLTQGKLSVVTKYCANVDKLSFLLGLIESNRHPVSVSMATHLKDSGIIASHVPGPQSLTAKGVEAIFCGWRFRAVGILTMMDASQKSVNRIKFNFAWSFVYNTFAVLLAAGAFVNARIPPEFEGLGELMSVLPVIAAAVLLRWSKI